MSDTLDMLKDQMGLLHSHVEVFLIVDTKGLELLEKAPPFATSYRLLVGLTPIKQQRRRRQHTGWRPLGIDLNAL